MNKYDHFYECNKTAGDIVAAMEKDFHIWGRFTIDSADFVVDVSKVEPIAPELFAVTWQWEYTFGFYAPANVNNDPDDFLKHDVGQMQLNVGHTLADIEVKFFSATGIDVDRALGTKSPRFNGDAMENARLAARKLLALGRGRLVWDRRGGVTVRDEQVVLFEKVTVEEFKALTEDQRNERRAVAYCGVRSRRHRQLKWLQYGSMFRKFFEAYTQ